MTQPLLRFVHLSDTHINPDVDYIKDYANYTPMTGAMALIDAVNALPFTPDFILHTGDVAYDPYPEVYDVIQDVLSKFNIPVYVLAGNHDDARALQHLVMGRDDDAVKDYLYYEFEQNGVQIVCLDSNGPAEIPQGNIPDEQLAWLDTLVSVDDDRPLVVATHHNVLPMNVPWLDGFMRTTNGEALHTILCKAQSRLRVVLHGHIHQNIDHYVDGILYSSCASSWCQFGAYPDPNNTEITQNKSAPPGFSVVTVSANSTYIRRHTFTVDSQETPS
ncbi:MAG: metallophosphoesterase family protein [Aggregatilineales bacterium]